VHAPRASQPPRPICHTRLSKTMRASQGRSSYECHRSWQSVKHKVQDQRSQLAQAPSKWARGRPCRHHQLLP